MTDGEFVKELHNNDKPWLPSLREGNQFQQGV